MQKDNLFYNLGLFFKNLKLDKQVKSGRDGGTVPISVRLESSLVQKIDAYSSALDLQRSTLIGLALKQSFEGQWLNKEVSSANDLIEARLWYLFKVHQLNNFDIISLVNGSSENKVKYTVRDLEDILSIMDTSLIVYIADFFEINPKWLMGESERIAIDQLPWYRNLNETVQTIMDVYNESKKNVNKGAYSTKLYFVIDNTSPLSDLVNQNDYYNEVGREGTTGANLGLALVMVKLLPNGKAVRIAKTSSTRLGERWSYYKTRRKFKKLLTAVEKISFNLTASIAIRISDFESIFSGKQAAIEFLDGSAMTNKAAFWHMEDYITNKYPADYEKEEAAVVAEDFNNDTKLLNILVSGGFYENVEAAKIKFEKEGE